MTMSATTTLSRPTTTAQWQDLGNGVSLGRGALTPRATELLAPPALGLLARLHRALEPERRALLAARRERQTAWDAGATPEYLDRTSEAAAGTWRVAEVPTDLRKRRVEITGPVNDTKMVINMLRRNTAGHRADTAMLDFEDSMKPTWSNVLAGLANVKEAVEGTLTYVKPARHGQPEKLYSLDPEDQAHLMVRVRGLHLEESNLRVDGAPISAGLFDLAVTFLHTARTLVDRGRTPTYYVPKCEHHFEARWWNRLFVELQGALNLPEGTLRATFLIETLPAAFQMEEILYEIRHHAAGLNVGRWDKIFSDIKVLMEHPDRILADRATIGMNRPWMENYARRLVAICHRRGAYAIGGMSAFTPGREAALRDRQTAKVLADKRHEAALGHDGCWVSHPYFLGPALSAFESDHQLDVTHPEFDKYPDLLPTATAPHTLAGLRTNLRVGIAYLKGWREGLGCVAWDNLMEDLATLEISRAQTWQWLHHGIELDDGPTVNVELIQQLVAEELRRIHEDIEATVADEELQNQEKAAFLAAACDVENLFTSRRFQPFLAEASEPA